MRNKHHIDTNMLPKGPKGYIVPDTINEGTPQYQMSMPPGPQTPGGLGQGLAQYHQKVQSVQTPSGLSY